MDNLGIDYKKATQQLRSGEAPFGKDGALAPMLERILKATLKVRWILTLIVLTMALAIVVMAR